MVRTGKYLLSASQTIHTMRRPILSLFFFLVLATFLNAQTSGIQFTGTGGGITLCESEDFDIGTGFTAEAWIFAPEWKSEFWQGSIILKDQQTPDAGYGLRAGKNGTLNFVTSVDGVWFETTTDPIMNTNQWYHVAAVVDETTVTLYINGTAQISQTFSGAPRHSAQPVWIGESFFPRRIWNGSIDEVRIWNVARTADEINDNQTTEFTGNEDGLIAYLPMSEGSGNTTANLANSDCDGNLSTENSWGDGYSVPPIDVGISAITAPDALSLYTRPVKPRVTIQNYGSEPITDVPVKLSVNSLPLLTATYTGTILAGESAEFVFETPIDLTGNNTNLLAATTELSTDPNTLNNVVSIRYRRPRSGDNGPMLAILNQEKHNFGSDGQTKFNTINLPENMEDYGRLLLHLSVACPTTGCDPWDQTGNLNIITPEGEFEIARFITPYRIACGGDEWIVDVTDLKSMLSGPVIFKSYIQVWGPSGWLLNADLEFIEDAQPLYQKTTPLWNTQYHVYGDPGINDDLPAFANTLATNTTDSRFRLTMSGHGQGNTDNAAEFSNKTHTLMLNGEVAASHNLWKADCAQNECANQQGTWEFNRAGWCPGQAVQPWTYDLGGDLFAGQELTIDYELEAYTNLLNTDYNDMGHTEPFYRIAGYLVEESETHFDSQTNLRADSVILTISDSEQRAAFSFTNTGSESVEGVTVALYINGELIEERDRSLTLGPGFSFSSSFAAMPLPEEPENQEIIAVVTTLNDDNVNDDATKAFRVNNTTAILNVSEAGVSVFPNPTSGRLNLQLTNEFLGGELELIDVQGRLLQTVQLESLTAELNVAQKGLVLLHFRTAAGKAYYQKVIVR